MRPDHDFKGEIKVRQLSKSFGTARVLREIDLTIDAGSIVCLMGKSGGGKSTLLRCLNLLEWPSGGSVAIGKHVIFDCATHLPIRDIVVLRQHVGMIFQSFNLFPHLTAAENVILAQTVAKHVNPSEALERAMSLLATVGLSHRAAAYPRQLSGGEQQRTAIARALAVGPDVLLCDEPTSALDLESTREVLNVLRRLAHRGMTMLIATHELSFARDVADRVIFMDDGQIIEDGNPEQVIDHPKERRTREFFEHVER
ncbi:amino acid ABC transporter ATP-binding protein [Acidisoma sp. S159]|uniref:amino acid ABC transporter ATP-binding protein n=1 Tax=Acidisoma sp. S159 TaxID=1747225 RepID=UPI00131D2510|nr:amino acid ABC transporter ATP-binding protein [Acidisoma sp. S159]